jgi:hypothetical protein
VIFPGHLGAGSFDPAVHADPYFGVDIFRDIPDGAIPIVMIVTTQSTQWSWVATVGRDKTQFHLGWDNNPDANPPTSGHKLPARGRYHALGMMTFPSGLTGADDVLSRITLTHGGFQPASFALNVGIGKSWPVLKPWHLAGFLIPIVPHLAPAIAIAGPPSYYSDIGGNDSQGEVSLIYGYVTEDEGES